MTSAPSKKQHAMNRPPNPRRRTAHLTVQPVGEETLLYDERAHKAFCLNRVAAAIWRLCDGTRTIAALAAESSAALAVPVSPQAVHLALSDLSRDGLLAEDVPLAMPPHQVSRRAMMAQMGAGATVLLPAVESVLAPRAAQAYTGCVNCSSLQRRQSPPQ